MSDTFIDRHKAGCRKGGLNIPREKRYFYRNREAARAAGRKGGMVTRAMREARFKARETNGES